MLADFRIMQITSWTLGAILVLTKNLIFKKFRAGKFGNLARNVICNISTVYVFMLVYEILTRSISATRCHSGGRITLAPYGHFGA
jgi:hypothetical protein